MDNADDDCMTRENSEWMEKVIGWGYDFDGSSGYVDDNIFGINEEESRGVAVKVREWVERQYWKIWGYASRFWYKVGL